MLIYTHPEKGERRMPLHEEWTPTGPPRLVEELYAEGFRGNFQYLDRI